MVPRREPSPAVSGVGWRLLMEPCGEALAWSLIRVDDGHPQGEVWCGFNEDASRLRRLVENMAGGALLDPLGEAVLARELGAGLLPAELRTGLTAGGPVATLTLLVRGWLASVPWEAVAVNWNGVRLLERCVILGGLTPGLTAALAECPISTGGEGTLWVVDPGPATGHWPPLFPGGYPAAIRSLPTSADTLVPGGFPYADVDLSTDLQPGRWHQLAYFGHVVSDPKSPAASALVLSGEDADLFSAHRWLAEPHRWPAPRLVALIGCGSDDSSAFEQSGLPTAALRAGAAVVTTTRWTLPNTKAAVALLRATALTQVNGAIGVRRWQLTQLDRWRRTGAPEVSPLYWSALVTYDRALLTGQQGDQ
jgi:CHAT domain